MQAWGAWVQVMVPRLVTVTRLVMDSKVRQGRALGSRAWVRATANRPRVVMDSKGQGMVSKAVAAMDGKQAAEVLALVVTLVTGRIKAVTR